MAVITKQYLSLVHFLKARSEDWRDRPAMRHKHLGIWKTITWGEYYHKVCVTAAACEGLDLDPNAASSILSENRPEWLIADFATMMCGLMSTGIYTTSSSSQIRYQVKHSDTQILFVEGGEQYEKLLEIDPKDLSALRRIVIFDMDGLDKIDDPRVTPWADFMEEGARRLEADPDLPDRLLSRISPDDIAILIYTSGTTGDPKGAMISHTNMLEQMQAWSECYDVDHHDRSVCFLPLCHVAERSFSAYSPMTGGMVVHFAESLSALLENMREVKPTMIFAPPRIYEKIHAAIDLAMKEARPSSQAAYRMARRWVDVANRGAGKPSGPRPSAWKRLRAGFGRHVVLRNALRNMGMSEVKYAIAGAAPVSPDLTAWYRGLGVNLFELYGMTETSGAQTRLHHEGPHRFAGAKVPLGEMKIGADSEILVRGPHVFKGYLKDPDSTAAAISPDGWLHTGDQGEIDADGNLSITGRIKDVMITSGGKNIAPTKIESMIKVSPYITDAILIGDGRPFVSALILIDYETTARLARDSGVSFTNYTDLARKPQVAQVMEEWLQDVNSRLNQVEKVKKFRVIDIELDAEDDELTPTMKLKRKKIENRFGHLIEAMYQK